MTSSTSATSSGSSALVISSSSSSRGCIASARTIATRCCWPPERRSGYSSRLSASPNRCEQPRRLLVRRAAGEAARLARRERHVLAHRHVREEVEGLEDDPDPAADAVDVDTAGGDLLAAHRDPPCVDRLEQVDAAQEGRLPRAGGADQAHDLVLGEREIDAAEHLELAERLVDALDEQRLAGGRLRRRAHASLPACWRLRSRATSQSVKRASGIVIATNSVAATR